MNRDMKSWLRNRGHADDGLFCHKCWGEAFLMAQMSGRSQSDCYNQILDETRDKVLAEVRPDTEAESEGEG